MHSKERPYIYILPYIYIYSIYHAVVACGAKKSNTAIQLSERYLELIDQVDNHRSWEKLSQLWRLSPWVDGTMVLNYNHASNCVSINTIILADEKNRLKPLMHH